MNRYRNILATMAMVIMMGLLWGSLGAASVRMDYSTGYSDSLHVHYGVFKSDTRPTTGDVLYFHGYGDRFENHLRLFKSMTDAGLRVIAFDLPSHGRTYGGGWDDLDWFSFRDLADIAGVIERETLEDRTRPLILSGWSTGGLLAIRMAQSLSTTPLSRLPKALLIFAPAVSVPMCVGEGVCQITNESLTHDTSRYARDVSPTSPLYRVKFATELLYEASQSWSPLPRAMPVLIWTAGDSEDRYINTDRLKSWVAQQRLQHPSIMASQCIGARHELDNETVGFGGDFVRNVSAEFVQKISTHKSVSAGLLSGSVCRKY